MEGLIILGFLIVVSWFTGSKSLKVIILAFFFSYPLIMGYTQLSGLDLNSLNFLGTRWIIGLMKY
ncbi:hypothetical protein B6U96_13105 [Archaeoglobales archaeon ex4484_92]|nr:MAG: hypothetical protein B6U96_13105 [Archaeoglobales archaeon ex4484_92]